MWTEMMRALVLTGVSLRVSLEPSVVKVVPLSVIEGAIMIAMMIALPPLCQGPGRHLQPSVLHPKLRGVVVGAMSIDDDSSAFSLSPPRKNPARKPTTSTSKKKIGGKHFLNDNDEDDVDSDDGKPPRKMSTRRKLGFNHSSNDEDEDDFDSDVEKEDKESDYIPQTDEAVNISSKENIFGDSAEVIANHKQAFMERAYPPGKEHSYTKSQSISAAIPTCRTKSELDYITFVVGN